MSHSYLVRYGMMGRVAQFQAEAADLARGQYVVIRSHRGAELGEVLVPMPTPSDPEAEAEAGSTAAWVLRPAGPDDLARARAGEADRADRFAICQRVFQDGVWPLELIDVEPLLDDRRTVLYYLGPHRLDVAGLLAAFRATCDLDVMLEAVGRDVPDEEVEAADAHDEPAGCGQCGSDGGGCGSSGGCGSNEGSSHGGCSDCGVKALLAGGRRALAAR